MSDVKPILQDSGEGYRPPKPTADPDRNVFAVVTVGGHSYSEAPTASPMSEPKPCPFCGSSNLEAHCDKSGSFVTCQDCNTFGPNDRGEHEPWDESRARQAAIDAWNVRHPGTGISGKATQGEGS